MNIVILLMPKKSYSLTIEENDYPFFLTEFGDQTLLERLVKPLLSIPNLNKLIFVSKQEYKEKFFLDKTLNYMFGDKTSFIGIKGDTQGALCSALLAVELVNNDMPLLIRTDDEIIKTDNSQIICELKKTNCDAGIVTFTSRHPRYSYALLEKNTQNVQEIQEKCPISDNACAGFYYFAQGSEFVAKAKQAIIKDSLVNNLFFLSCIYNEFILERKSIKAIKIDNKDYQPIKNTMQLTKYLESF